MNSTTTLAPLQVAPETFVIQNIYANDGAPIGVHMNAMLIHGAQTVVVDTDSPIHREVQSPAVRHHTTRRCRLKRRRRADQQRPRPLPVSQFLVHAHWAARTVSVSCSARAGHLDRASGAGRRHPRPATNR